MARGLEAQLNASGRRFEVRRLIHTLVRDEATMVDEPVRAQSISLSAGCLLGLLLTGVCVLVAVASPSGALGDAPIVMARETGALYVRIGSVLLSGVDFRCLPLFPIRNAVLHEPVGEH